MVYETLFSPNAVVALATWAGIVLSYTTIQTFTLRRWKNATYYFLGAMVVFMVYQTVLVLPVLPPIGALSAVFKTVFALLVLVGVYKLRETAGVIGV